MALYNLGQFDKISRTDFKVELCNSFILPKKDYKDVEQKDTKLTIDLKLV